MSRAPLVMAKATQAFSRTAEMYDSTIGWRFVNPKFKKQYGITTETIGPADIRTAEQGQFLTLLINEIDSTL